jgi:hypothetical protein
MTIPDQRVTISDQQGKFRFHHSALHAQPSPINYYLLTINSQKKTVRVGFTLIETSLALLAIGLGLIALFGLGRIGLQNVKESENDTRCAHMADAIFETLRDTNARFVDAARTNDVQIVSWSLRWQEVWQNTRQIPFPVVANMSASPDLTLKFFTPLAPAYDENELSLLNWNPRYELAILPGDISHVAGTYNVMNVTLAIYPDGDSYSSERRLYHTTLTNPGGLP